MLRLAVTLFAFFGLLGIFSISSAAFAQSYEIIDFRKSEVDVFDENVRRIMTVPRSSLEALVGTTVSLDRNTSLYVAQMKGKKILLSPDDVVATTGAGGSAADLCLVLAGQETNSDTASSFGNICN